MNTGVFHVEQAELDLKSDYRGLYGIQLQSPTYSTPTSLPVINFLESGSPAEFCGRLRVGDRLVAVGPNSARGLSADDAMELLHEQVPDVRLKVEFDVAESIVPSTGKFDIKVSKRNKLVGVEIGDRVEGRGFEIRRLVKGSPAHRMGAVQPGDRLVAVDEVRVESCDRYYVDQLLTSQNDVVKLTIEKIPEGDRIRDDSEVVTIYRNGEPLGITISGDEFSNETVNVSDVIRGGIADKSGKILENDIILEINSAPLSGKSLMDAIQMLQNAGDVVELKIQRPANIKLGLKLRDELERSLDFLSNTLEDVNPIVRQANEFFTGDKCNAIQSINGSDELDKVPISNFSFHLDNFPLASQDLLNSSQAFPVKSALSTDVGQKVRPFPMIGDPGVDHKELELKEAAGLLENKYSSRDIFVVQSSRSSREARDSGVSSIQIASASFAAESSSSDVWSRVVSELSSEGAIKDLRDFALDGESRPSHNSSEETLAGEDFSACRIPEMPPLGKTGALLAPDSGSRTASTSVSDLAASVRTIDTQSDQTCSRLGYEPSRSNSSYSSQAYRRGSPPLDKRDDGSDEASPVEIHRVALFKDRIYEDFGLSLSDGLYEKGVFIKKMRKGGPAEGSGILKPYDRVLQVNNSRTHHLDCCMLVPLIAAAGDRLDLVVARKPLDLVSECDEYIWRQSLNSYSQDNAFERDFDTPPLPSVQ